MNRFLKVCMIKYDYEQINKSEFAEGLVMIHYDIDTTENGYKKFEGNIELLKNWDFLSVSQMVKIYI